MSVKLDLYKKTKKRVKFVILLQFLQIKYNRLDTITIPHVAAEGRVLDPERICYDPSQPKKGKR